MTLLDRLPLRKLLTVPYVALVLTLALVVGALSYRAGREVVDDLAGQLLREQVNRIALATQLHVGGSKAVLEAAFPTGVLAPTAWDPATLAKLRSRFWVATSIHRDANSYAYYGDREGRFFGLSRSGESDGELRVRLDDQSFRQIQSFSGVQGEPQPAVAESRPFDPRERPWFKLMLHTTVERWTPIYIDFRNAELVTTRARRVLDADGAPVGVVATDLPLQRISTFLRRLELSTNAVAMIVEADGAIVGVSHGDTTGRDAEGRPIRLNASTSRESLVVDTFDAVRHQLSNVQHVVGAQPDDEPRSMVFNDRRGREVQTGFAKLEDDAGLDWWIMVAVPRSDFLGQVQRSLLLTGWLTLAAAAVATMLGLAVLSIVAGELRRLADAARSVGSGNSMFPLATQRKDELGDLARSFADMQSRLLTDKLTGLHNREALLRHMQDRIQRHRRRGDAQPFAVLFADLNRFKQVNDRFGHDVGDAVLCEMAARIRRHARAQDLVARYAGDEFVVLLDSVESAANADTVRIHLEGVLSEPLQALQAVAPGERATGATFGMAIYPEDGEDVDALLKHADDDMYRRKGSRLGHHAADEMDD